MNDCRRWWQESLAIATEVGLKLIPDESEDGSIAMVTNTCQGLGFAVVSQCYPYGLLQNTVSVAIRITDPDVGWSELVSICIGRMDDGGTIGTFSHSIRKDRRLFSAIVERWGSYSGVCDVITQHADDEGEYEMSWKDVVRFMAKEYKEWTESLDN